MTEPEKDRWGRIPGMVHKAGAHIRNGWYYEGEFIASELREAYRIIRARLKENNDGK
jgi:hypothetical protein